MFLQFGIDQLKYVKKVGKELTKSSASYGLRKKVMQCFLNWFSGSNNMGYGLSNLSKAGAKTWKLSNSETSRSAPLESALLRRWCNDNCGYYEYEEFIEQLNDMEHNQGARWLFAIFTFFNDADDANFKRKWFYGENDQWI